MSLPPQERSCTWGRHSPSLPTAQQSQPSRPLSQGWGGGSSGLEGPEASPGGGTEPETWPVSRNWLTGEASRGQAQGLVARILQPTATLSAPAPFCPLVCFSHRHTLCGEGVWFSIQKDRVRDPAPHSATSQREAGLCSSVNKGAVPDNP